MGTTLQIRTDLLAAADVIRSLEAGAVVVDVRDPATFDAGHARGAINVPDGLDTGTVARHLVALDAPIIALAAGAAEARRAAADLRADGFRHVLGCVAGHTIAPLLGHAAMGRSRSIEVDRLGDELATGAVLLVDVRDRPESSTGRVTGSVQLPLADLRRGAHLLPGVPTVTACSDGRRAAAAASALRRFGHRNVWRADGGGVEDLLAHSIGLDLLGAA
jgi:hydroxyacylglutathione hydrolase